MVLFIEEGRIIELIYAIAFILVGLYYVNRAKTGWKPVLRSIAALDAIDDMVGRSVEMGRPIHVSPGIGRLDEQTIVGLEIIRYTAEKSAEAGARIIATMLHPQQLPIVQDLVKNAFIKSGNPESYNPEDVRYIANMSNAYATGVQGIIERERCSGNICVGQSGGILMMMFARAKIVMKDVMNLGGTAYIGNVTHCIITCDYVLIAEELYAVSAYLGKEPDQLAMLRTQDISKLWVIAIFIILIISSIFGIDTIFNILVM